MVSVMPAPARMLHDGSLDIAQAPSETGTQMLVHA
jgi:hypothetical protein